MTKALGLAPRTADLTSVGTLDSGSWCHLQNCATSSWISRGAPPLTSSETLRRLGTLMGMDTYREEEQQQKQPPQQPQQQ